AGSAGRVFDLAAGPSDRASNRVRAVPRGNDLRRGRGLRARDRLAHEAAGARLTVFCLTRPARAGNIRHLMKGQTNIGGGTGMKYASHLVRLLALFLLAGSIAAVACNRGDRAKSDGGASASVRAGAAAGEKFPEPRWPSYFKPPKSVEDLMDAARALVRNQSGLQGKGMGILQPGESVLIVAANNADPMVLEAIRRALVERKVTPHIKFTYEMTGQTKEDAERDRSRRERGRNIEHAGIYQASQWITGQFPNPAQPKAWLKQRNPAVYAELFPGETTAPPAQTAASSAPRQRPRGEGAEDADTGAPSGTADYQGRNRVG